MSLGDIAVLLTALGVGGILRDLSQRIAARVQGRTEQEQNAWQQRDLEARHRRILEEALHQHRTQWLERGMPFDDLPPWPTRPGK